jgi:hypothetical protein
MRYRFERSPETAVFKPPGGYTRLEAKEKGEKEKKRGIGRGNLRMRRESADSHKLDFSRKTCADKLRFLATKGV